MFHTIGPYYDRLYGFVDYAGATAKLMEIIRTLRPDATTLLDVACGTGRHLEGLRAAYRVEGLDLDETLIGLARARNPGVPFTVGDMTRFDLGRRFDVVTCLFSSIAYVQTIANVEAAVRRMREHLNPGGLLIVEPWIWPERYHEGRLVGNFLDEPDLKISWIYVNAREDDVSVLDIHYTVGEPGGVRQFRETHRMGLFTDAEYRGAFEKAGLAVTHDDTGLLRRGLYIGQATD